MFNAIINGSPVCVEYLGDFDSSPTHLLQEIQSGNLINCSNCSPILSQTPTMTNTPSVTMTMTNTPTPSVTPCVLKGMDTTFIIGSGFIGTVNDSYVFSNGKILICGSFNQYGTNTGLKSIIRLNSNGTIDNTFNPTTLLQNSNIVKILVDEINESIYVSGGGFFIGILKIDYNGNIDSNFYGNLGVTESKNLTN